MTHTLLLVVLLALALAGCYPASTQTLGTPMPTFVSANPPQFVSLDVPPTPQGQSVCRVKAVDLLGAWVAAGAPESDPFPFTDLAGDACQGSYAADIQPLFIRSNVWYPGVAACSTCHNADLVNAWAQLT
ncbi:MAG: hypothetical protein ACKOC5_13270 [Chloroflexota bacterium]